MKIRLSIVIKVIVLAFLVAVLGCRENTSELPPENGKLDPVDWSQWNEPPLVSYIRADDVEGLKRAIEENPEIVKVTAPNGSGSALFSAVRLSREEMVGILINHGMDINETLGVISYNSPNIPEMDMTGWTPLHQAVEGQDEAMVQTLLELGADPSATFRGETPAEMAERMGYEGIVHLLESETN